MAAVLSAIAEIELIVALRIYGSVSELESGLMILGCSDVPESPSVWVGAVSALFSDDSSGKVVF